MASKSHKISLSEPTSGHKSRLSNGTVTVVFLGPSSEGPAFYPFHLDSFPKVSSNCRLEEGFGQPGGLIAAQERCVCLFVSVQFLPSLIVLMSGGGVVSNLFLWQATVLDWPTQKACFLKRKERISRVPNPSF